MAENGNIEITEEVFKRMPPEDRDWLVFRSLNKRITVLEKRKNFDTSLSGLMGLIGGGFVWFIKGILKIE